MISCCGNFRFLNSILARWFNSVRLNPVPAEQFSTITYNMLSWRAVGAGASLECDLRDVRYSHLAGCHPSGKRCPASPMGMKQDGIPESRSATRMHWSAHGRGAARKSTTMKCMAFVTRMRKRNRQGRTDQIANQQTPAPSWRFCLLSLQVYLSSRQGQPGLRSKQFKHSNIIKR